MVFGLALVRRETRSSGTNAGVVIGAFVLKGAMLGSPGFDTPRLDYKTGTVLIVRERWGLTLLWLASHFTIQVQSIGLELVSHRLICSQRV